MQTTRQLLPWPALAALLCVLGGNPSAAPQGGQQSQRPEEHGGRLTSGGPGGELTMGGPGGQLSPGGPGGQLSSGGPGGRIAPPSAPGPIGQGHGPCSMSRQGPFGPGLIVVDPSPGDLNGTWKLRWDDSVDLTVSGGVKECEVILHAIDGQLSGRFEGPVLGVHRDAFFQGELSTLGASPLMTLTQRERGYVCSYQLTWTKDHCFVGTWMDVRGGGGTVELVRARGR